MDKFNVKRQAKGIEGGLPLPPKVLDRWSRPNDKKQATIEFEIEKELLIRVSDKHELLRSVQN